MKRNEEQQFFVLKLKYVCVVKKSLHPSEKLDI